MAYSSGMLNQRVELLKRVQAAGKISRNSGAYSYETLGAVWADVTWKKGQKTLNEGAFDSQDTVMIRMRWNSVVTRDTFLRHDGVVYQIQSMHRDRQENTIQITAVEATMND